MNINFYNKEETPMYYTVIESECSVYNEMDKATEIGYLANGTIYPILDYIIDSELDVDWVKIKMYDGEYYAIVDDSKCIIETLPVIEELYVTEGFFKRLFRKIFKK